MAEQGSFIDDAEQRAHLVFAGGSRHPGRCASSASALPCAPASAVELWAGEVDR